MMPSIFFILYESMEGFRMRKVYKIPRVLVENGKSSKRAWWIPAFLEVIIITDKARVIK